MAARSSYRDNFEPDTKIWTECHTLTPISGWNGPEDSDACGSAPSCSPSQSPARTLAPDQPETWYCLEIQLVSIEDDKAIPPPSHAWQAQIVEDMVHEGRTGLTEPVLTGPGRAVLFYGCHSLGEGLNLGEARDATFTLSGIIAWVGKQAQISTKPISLANDRQLIAQAIIKGHIEPRGPGHPWSTPPASMPFNFHNQDMSPWPANFPANAEWWEVPQLGPQVGQQEWGCAPQQGWNWGQRQMELWVASPLLPHSCLTMDLRETEAQHQLHHQCLQCLRDQEDPGVHIKADIPAGNQEAIWRSTSQSLKMRTPRMPLHTRVGAGT